MFYIGLDLGIKQDHSAIAVVERCEPLRHHSAPRHETQHVRYLERIALGTPFSKIIERTRAIVRGPDLAGNCRLAVDATGLGIPMVEMLRTAELGCEINAITITSGRKQNSYQTAGIPSWNVPKLDLISALQIAIENGRLKIAGSLRHTASLTKELLDMQGTLRPTGNLKTGADGAGQHDDLVIALALASWLAARKQIGFGTSRLF